MTKKERTFSDINYLKNKNPLLTINLVWQGKFF